MPGTLVKSPRSNDGGQASSAGGKLRGEERLERRAKALRQSRRADAESNDQISVAKKGSATGANRKFFAILTKSMLQIVQGQKDHTGVLFDTFVIKTSSEEATSSAEQGEAYADTVTGNRDNG